MEMKGLFLKHELNDNVCITRCFCSSKNSLVEFFYFTMSLEYATTELQGELLNQL